MLLLHMGDTSSEMPSVIWGKPLPGGKTAGLTDKRDDKTIAFW